jgi:hypothetical protein
MFAVQMRMKINCVIHTLYLLLLYTAFIVIFDHFLNQYVEKDLLPNSLVFGH